MESSSSEDTFDYDLLVIGSGPAGIHAAVQAAKLKKRVAIIEKTSEHIGGSWIHTGTLPSKTLRESLATVQSIRSHVGDQWVDRILDDLPVNKLFARAKRVSEQEEALVRDHIERNEIKLIDGHGSLESEFSVRVVSDRQKPYTLSSANILIATGSRPRRPEEIPFDGWRVVDADEILSLEAVPRSMLIYGAGVIACEYACIFSALRSKVTVIDSRSRVMQYLDSEIGSELQASMEALGVRFVLGKKLEKVEVAGPEVICTAGGEKLSGDLLFFAAGRTPVIEHIGLERLGIKRNKRGDIEVNENFQTNIANIYAAGDVIGPPALAATSNQQGRHVACHAFGAAIDEFPRVFPVGVYTIPELSMVGQTEDELLAKNIPHVVGRAAYSEIARGYIRGDVHGLLKVLVCTKTHQILGIHIVGDDACNLVHIGLALMLNHCTIQDMLRLVFNYPTLAEGYRIAAFNALNKIFPDGYIRQPPALEEARSIEDKAS